MNLAFSSRSMLRKHGAQDPSEFAGHDAVRSATVDLTMPVPDTGAFVDGGPLAKGDKH